MAEVFSLNAVGVSIVIVVVGYTLLPLAFVEVEGWACVWLGVGHVEGAGGVTEFISGWTGCRW